MGCRRANKINVNYDLETNYKDSNRNLACLLNNIYMFNTSCMYI